MSGIWVSLNYATKIYSYFGYYFHGMCLGTFFSTEDESLEASLEVNLVEALRTL
jgi:hypothetical protein